VALSAAATVAPRVPEGQAGEAVDARWRTGRQTRGRPRGERCPGPRVL